MISAFAFIHPQVSSHALAKFTFQKIFQLKLPYFCNKKSTTKELFVIVY